MKQELKQLADISGHKILGNPNSEKGNIQEIDMGFGLSFSGGTVSVNLELNDLIDVTTNFPLNPTESDDGKMLFYDHSIGEWTTDDSVTHGTVVINGKKASAGTISKGLPVYLVGFDADLHTVELANATSGSTMPVIGFTTENMDSTNPKHIITFGKLTGIDTTSTVTTLNPNGETWTVNDALYISTTSGGLTKFRPTGGTTQIQRIAKVLRVSSTGGQLFIFNTARTAGLPNLSTNKLWMGNNNGQPIEMSLGDGFTLSSGTISVDANYGNLYVESTGNKSTIRKEIGASASSPYSSIFGGCMNTSSACYGTILNGRMNTILGGPYNSILNGNSNTNSGYISSNITSGTNNIIATPSQYSTIDNGTNNNVNGCYSVILNGSNNDIETTSQYSIIGSGLSNVSVGSFNVINSGQSNTIDGSSTNISTGRFNTISGSYNNISTGTYNIISGSNNFIGSGSSNTLTGTCISVLGNSIVATYSNTTYVNKLIINDTPTTNNSNTNLLVRNSSGQIELREASSFSGTNFANSDLTLTASRTHQLNGFDLTIAGGTNSTDRAFVVNSFKDVYTRGKGDQNNLVLGFNTGRSITSASNNVILGDLAGQNMTTAQNTVLIGRSAGAAITTTANQTVAIGRGALENITVSSDNTAIGYFALNAQTGSQFNTALGSSAGSTLTNGGSNVFIGHNAQPLNTTDNNSIVIGRNAVGLGGGTVVLGSSVITRTQLRGRVEMDTTTDGILLPRLTTALMNAIVSPVTNTILYNTDLNGLYRYNGSAWVPLVSFYGGKRYTLIKPNGTQTFYDNLSQVRLNWADGDVLHQFADETLSITNTTTISGYLCWSELPAISWNGNGHSVLFNVTNTSAFAVNANKNINLFDLRLTYNCADNSTTNGLIKSPTTSFLNGNGGTTLVQNVTASNANHLNAFGLIGNFDNFNITSLHDKTWQVPGFCNGTFTNCNIKKVYTNRAATFIGCNFNDFVANLFTATNIIFDNCTLVNSVDALFSSNGGTATITDCTMRFNVNSGTIINTTVVMNNSTINNVGNGLMFAAYSGRYNICKTTGSGGFLNTASVVTDYSSIFESTGGWNFRFTGSGSVFERTKFINNGTGSSLNTDVAGSGLQASFVDCIFFCAGTNNVGAVSNTYSFVGCTFNRTNFAFMYSGTQQQLLDNIPQRLTQMKDSLGNFGHGLRGNTLNVTTAQMNAISSPVTNLIVYNTDLSRLHRYTGSGWVPLIAGLGNQTTTSTATLTINSNLEDLGIITAQAVALTIAAPTGTPTQGQKLIFRIKDNGTARTITWNAIFRIIGTTLPTTTVINKTTYVGCIYNSTDTKWDVVVVNTEV